jgi:hypothetical protein
MQASLASGNACALPTPSLKLSNTRRARHCRFAIFKGAPREKNTWAQAISVFRKNGHMAHGTWHMAHGTWQMAHGKWHMAKENLEN